MNSVSSFEGVVGESVLGDLTELLRVVRQRLLADPRHADALAREALALAEQQGDAAGGFEALALGASARLSLSDFAEADRLIAALGAAADTPGRHARHLTLLAIRAQRAGELVSALSLVHEALHLLDGVPDARDRSAAMTHNAAGNLLSQFGDFPGAIEQFHLALSLADEEDDHIRPVVANNIGRAHRELRQFEAAEAVLEAALGRLPPADTSVIRSVLLGNLGQVLVDDARPGQALAPLHEALRVSHLRGFTRGLGAAHHSLGLAYRALGDLSAAYGHFEAARALRSRSGELLDLAETRVELARLLHLQGRGVEAEGMLVPLVEGPGATEWAQIRVGAWELLYEIYRGRGELEQALDAHVAFHEQSKVYLDDQARRRFQALEVRFRTAQLARETDRARAKGAALEALAHTDPLTGVPNRRFVDAHLDRVLPEARRSGRPVAIAIFDVDHFKLVNDRFSHAIGDTVLREFATVLQVRLRSRDVVARYGGEEFVVVFADATAETAAEVSGRLLHALREHDWTAVHPELRVSASAGVADTRVSGGRGALFDAADVALYRAKAEGRDRVVVAELPPA